MSAWQSCRRNQVMLVRPAPLTIRGVFATLRKIAEQKVRAAGKERAPKAVGDRAWRDAAGERVRWQEAAAGARPAPIRQRRRDQVPGAHAGAEPEGRSELAKHHGSSWQGCSNSPFRRKESKQGPMGTALGIRRGSRACFGCHHSVMTHVMFDETVGSAGRAGQSRR